MRWIKEYGFPTLLITIASVLVCLGLWFIYTVNEDTVTENVSSTAELVQESELEMPDLGVLMPILSFVLSGLKVAIVMGVPGLITIGVLRYTKRKMETENLAVT